MRGRILLGNPNTSVAIFEFESNLSGPLTIKAHSLDFDIALKVSRVSADDTLTVVGADDNGGIGTDSRLVVEAQTNVRYQLEVRSMATFYCGGDFELSVALGKLIPPEANAKDQAERTYWESVDTRAKERNKPECRVEALLHHARFLKLRSVLAEARPLAESALTMAEDDLGPEHPLVATSLNDLAQILQDEGSYVEAKPLLERALAIREKQLGLEHPDVADVIGGLGYNFGQLGLYSEAKPLMERALAIREKKLGPENPDIARSLNNLAQILKRMGAYAEAKPLHERALAIWEKQLGPEHPNVAVTLNNLGTLFLAMGAYEEAKPLFERALAISEKQLGPEHPSVANYLNNLGKLFLTMGDYAEAKPLFERALAIREKKLGHEHPSVAWSLSDLGSLFRAMSSYAEAKPLFERALAIREKSLGPEHPDVALSLGDLASLLEETGSYAEAKALYERALAIREKSLGPEHPDVAVSLGTLALLFEKMGDYSDARALYNRSLTIEEKQLGADHPSLARTLADLGRLLAVMGESTPALKAALQAEEIGRDHLRLMARALPERQALGYASVRAAGLNLALSLAAERREEIPDSTQSVWDALIRSRALVLDEMGRRHQTLAEASDSEVSHLAESLASASNRLANLWVRGPEKEPPERYRKMLDEARSQKEQAERFLAEKSTTFREQQEKRMVGLDQVVMHLPRSSALIAYARYDKLVSAPPKFAETSSAQKRTRPEGQESPSQAPTAYLAFVLGAGETKPIIVPLGLAQTIDALVRRWQEEAASTPSGTKLAMRRDEAHYRDAGEKLRRAVWDPVRENLNGAQQVFIVPDGALHLVSLATLPVGRDRYLVETGPLFHYLSAERDLIREGKDRPIGRGLFVLGGPDFDSQPGSAPEADGSHVTTPGPTADARESARPARYRSPVATCQDFRSMRFAPLPESAIEAEEVASLWPGHFPGGQADQGAVLKLTGTAAGEAAFKNHASGHRVLHLATHGFFVDDRCPSILERAQGPNGSFSEAPPTTSGDDPLLLSGLALAGANLRDAPGTGADAEDGILTAEEIASLDLTGVEWVVLSACETGLGKLQEGEGMLGLRRAFEIAGARTLIMSLWKVDDAGARDWMRLLYRDRNAGLSTAEAVRHAGLAMLEARRGAGASTHPFFWGAFVAAGDWR